jgi:hypothetical protein
VTSKHSISQVDKESHPHVALDLRIRCQARQIRRRRGERCTAPARYWIVADAFQGETMVCGTHARSWTPSARKPLGVALPQDTRTKATTADSAPDPSSETPNTEGAP